MKLGGRMQTGGAGGSGGGAEGGYDLNTMCTCMKQPKGNTKILTAC